MDYRNVSIEDLGLTPGQKSPSELYVKMPATGEWAVLVQEGEVISAQRWKNLRDLAQDKNLFIRADFKLPEPEVALPDAEVQFPEVDPSGTFVGDVLTTKAEAALKDEFRKLLNSPQAIGASLSVAVTKMAEDLYKILVPEAGAVRDDLLKKIKNLQQLNDAGAIATIAVLCATANDFKSKTAYLNLCLGALLMDASLAELSPEELETFYRDRTQLSAAAKAKVQNHPLRSQQLVANMPEVNDVINQMILMHHELNNGTGYHKGIRTASASTLVRVLALAVDVYENLRGAELNKNPITIEVVLAKLMEKGAEPHLRRHAAKLVENVVTYLKK